jgi:hypothetical protein
MGKLVGTKMKRSFIWGQANSEDDFRVLTVPFIILLILEPTATPAASPHAPVKCPVAESFA